VVLGAVALPPASPGSPSGVHANKLERQSDALVRTPLHRPFAFDLNHSARTDGLIPISHDSAVLRWCGCSGLWILGDPGDKPHDSRCRSLRVSDRRASR